MCSYARLRYADVRIDHCGLSTSAEDRCEPSCPNGRMHTCTVDSTLAAFPVSTSSEIPWSDSGCLGASHFTPQSGTLSPSACNLLCFPRTPLEKRQHSLGTAFTHVQVLRVSRVVRPSLLTVCVFNRCVVELRLDFIALPCAQITDELLSHSLTDPR